jgi:hypothetical protein
MKNSLLALLVFVFFLNLSSKADEGMWLPSLIGKLNIQKMNSMGCNLTAEQIYSINHSSLKDAVVALDHGQCTAELVSADWLLLTNHHCGFGEIQAHSSVEHDYLHDGFWALKRENELSNPGKTVTFLIRMEDVTDQVLKNVTDDMDDITRFTKVRDEAAKIEKDAKGDTGYETRVRSLYESNKYYLFVYETFKDIRLVGTPPQSIGKFGDETDNWMWPRHTGDFSMFRIYCSPDGKPAEYSKDNVPYHPKSFLPISIKGVEKNSFAMVMGYPGTTTRYRTSAEVKYTMDVVNDIRITAREVKQNIIKDYMASSQKARIQYASKYARSSNYYKYSIGQNKGLIALDVIGKKQMIEKDFLKWVSESPERKVKYGSALDSINAAFSSRDEKIAIQYAREALLGGAEIFSFAAESSSLYEALKGTDKVKIDAAVEELRSSLKEYFRDYDADTDQKVAGKLLKLYASKVDPRYIPRIFREIERKFKGDFDAYARKLFKETIFADESKMEAFLNKPSRKALDKDMAFDAMRSIYEAMGIISHDYGKSTAGLDKARRLFVAGLNEMNKDKLVYPDANSTMRLTYGIVGGYVPRDATYYDYFTTLKGYIEKGIPGDIDYDFPKKLVDMYNAKDFGQYGDKDGTLHTCFISNNDITGGNSGSPVINGDGELIGIAFDGNWEAMSGDIAFEPELQKCINVDIRFVLWTIDKFAGASHLIDEMKLVK